MSIKHNMSSIPGLWFFVFIIIGFIAVLGRCFDLQYNKYDQYKAKADKQQLKIIEHSAARGMIFDCKGRILVAGRQGYSIAIDPKVLDGGEDSIKKISNELNLNQKEVLDEYRSRINQRFMYVKRDIPKDKADTIRNFGIRGVVVRNEYFRDYPMGSLAAPVLGITDIYNVGLEGIEKQYDDYLKGEPGKSLYRMDVLRRPIGPHAISEGKESKDGCNIALTIDAVIQDYAEKALKDVVKKYQAKDAVCVVMVPQTGEILACANYPSFDITRGRQYPTEKRKNLATNIVLEPGSTFKPVTVASAIEKKIVNMNTTVDCLTGPFYAKGMGRIREYKYYHGKISVAEILAKSSNIGTAKLALRMGKEYFHDMIEKFGFGQKTFIDLPGEESGIFVNEWNDKNYTFTRTSFGQGGISATPLQLLRAFCVFANGGKLVRPFIVAGITDSNGVVENFKNYSLPMFGDVSVPANDQAAQVVSESTAAQMVKALQNVVDTGTGKPSKLDKWTVFGKTGTANVPKTNGPGYEDYKWNSSFIAGAPASDPKVCILVTVRDPDRSLGHGYTGGAVAGPVVKEILEQTLTYLMVPPDKEYDED